MLGQGMEYVVELAKKKKHILDTDPIQYIMRAALAGIFIGFIIVVCFKLGEFFNAANSPATYLVSSLFFGTALIMIMYGGAELFTGNTMYFTVSTMRKETTLTDTLRNWGAVYAGNFIGAVFFAFLFHATGLFEHIPHTHLLNKVVETKMTASSSHIFFKAVLCNWLVCLACFLPSQVKGDVAKMGIMFLLVFSFFLSGYEHCVANLSLFSIALLSPHPETVSFTGALHNLIPATLGNIVGGSIFVGMVYQYITRTPVEKSVILSKAEQKENTVLNM
ncbi:formate/nitrite transporter family protein [Bacillus sp. 165]|uniref:formate/nitrite transporter family protein n=1 Tax=Bacillus sp. 165 TaxID=1529117 RepID=UPI001AD9A109|nr:formate/nitrite transporter family protein [Bacillus sp. 165]MBO9128469.1 formate/nitrite transporter family protein [Bacillus sp. 165]